MLSDSSIRDRLDSGSIEIENIGSLDSQLQAAGIDLRVGPDYKRKSTDRVISAETNPQGALIFEPGVLYQVHTVEQVKFPDDLVGYIDGRSTLKWAGLDIMSGTVSPGYEGVLRLSVINHSEEPIHVESEYEFINLSFTALDQSADTPYGAQNDSQYQGQDGLEQSQSEFSN